MALNLTIDPDVFYAAKNCNNDCYEQLIVLKDKENKLLFTIAVDKEGMILGEYVKIMEQSKSEKSLKAKTIARILKNLIFTSNDILYISTTLFPSDLSAKVLKCPKIEQQMLKMAYQILEKKDSGLTILLTGYNDGDFSHRCLNDKNLKNVFQKKIKGFRVQYVKDGTKIKNWNKKTSTKTLTVDQHVHFFERETQHHIRFKFQCRHIMEQREVEKEEIDVYCYQKTGDRDDPRVVCIGECKLRFKNPDDVIKRKEILQLEKKIKAAQCHEKKRGNGENNFKIKAFLISNANDMEEDAWDYAINNLGVEFYFVHVKMPEEWQDKPRWNINDSDLEFRTKNKI